MRHYTEDELELFRHKEMSVLGRINCASHLKECPACAKLLAELEENDKLVQEVRNSMQSFQSQEATHRKQA